jgi:hypothetical protein
MTAQELLQLENAIADAEREAVAAEQVAVAHEASAADALAKADAEAAALAADPSFVPSKINYPKLASFRQDKALRSRIMADNLRLVVTNLQDDYRVGLVEFNIASLPAEEQDEIDGIVTEAEIAGPVAELETASDEMLTKTADACDVGGTFKGSFPSFPDFDGPDISGLTDGIENAIGDATEKIGELTKTIKTAISDAIGNLKTFTSDVRARAAEFLTAIRNATGTLLTNIQAAFDNFKGVIATAKAAITAAIGNAVTAAQDLVTAVGEKITSMLGELGKVASSSKVDGCGIASSVMGALGSGVSSALDAVSAGVEAGIGASFGLINDQASKLTAVGAGLAADAASFASFDSATEALGITSQFDTFAGSLNIQIPTV